MRAKQNLELHYLLCLRCFKSGIPVWRSKSKRRGKEHLKKMYCCRCKKEVNHMEFYTQAEMYNYIDGMTSGKKIIMMVGVPASGKSTLVKKLMKVYDNAMNIYISRDEIRFAMLENNEDYYSKETSVFDCMIYLINAAAAKLKDSTKDVNIIIDATHINAKSRRKVLSRLKIPNGTYSLLVLNVVTPIEKCINRDANRKGRQHVGEQVIKDMMSRYEEPEKKEFSYVGWSKNSIEILEYNMEGKKCTMEMN